MIKFEKKTLGFLCSLSCFLVFETGAVASTAEQKRSQRRGVLDLIRGARQFLGHTLPKNTPSSGSDSTGRRSESPRTSEGSIHSSVPFHKLPVSRQDEFVSPEGFATNRTLADYRHFFSEGPFLERELLKGPTPNDLSLESFMRSVEATKGRLRWLDAGAGRGTAQIEYMREPESSRKVDAIGVGRCPRVS